MRTTLLMAMAMAMISFSSMSEDIATIGPASFVGSTGAVTVNIASGDFNIQSSNLVHSEQNHSLNVIASPTLSLNGHSATASVVGDAFSNTSGYISVNVAAGNSNQQHNIVVFSPDNEVEWQVVELSADRAFDRSSNDSVNILKSELSPNALANSGGVIQMSQVAGTGNTARNTFQMPTTIN